MTRYDADYDRQHARETIARDVELLGIAFAYDGQPLDPTKITMYRRHPDGGATEVDEYDEWRLTGLPGGGYSPYEHVTRIRPNIEALREIWAKIKDGRYSWTDAKLTRRHVTITRTPWVEED